MNTAQITRQRIAINQRVTHTARLFGHHFPLTLEVSIFNIAGSLAAEYDGGYWDMYKLSNGGFYMAPASEEQFSVSSENGYEGSMSGDALGLVVCLFAFSLLSYGDGAFAEICAQQYHLLREFALDHAEAGSIMQAID